MKPERLKTIVTRCARCKLDHEVVFYRFRLHNVVDQDGTVWDMWGMCPTTHEPIFLQSDKVEPDGSV